MIIGAKEIVFYDDAHARIVTSIKTPARVAKEMLKPKAGPMVTPDCMIA